MNRPTPSRRRCNVIARLWSAKTTHAQRSAYADHLRKQVLPAVRKLEGYAGALLLEREASDQVEIVVITFWHSLDSIRAFAGADLEQAVVANEAASLQIGRASCRERV